MAGTDRLPTGRGLCFSLPVLAPISPLIGLLLGLLFSWASSPPQSGARAGLSSRVLLLVILFSLLVFAPICSYFLAFAPDWSYAYLLDSEQLPSTVDLALVLINAASIPGGYLIGAQHLRTRPASRITRLAFAPALLSLFFVAVTIRRLGVDASYAQYHGDFGTRPLAGSPLGYSVLWMLAVLSGATAWTAHYLKLMASRQ